MHTQLSSWKKIVAALSDEALLARTRSQADGERAQTAWLVAHLAEVFRRDLALKRGFRSLYQCARSELGLADGQAWERVAAARLSLELPETPERIARGELNLCDAVAVWRTIAEAGKTPPRPAAQATELPLPVAPAPEAPRPPTIGEKRELLGQVLGKSRRESAAALHAWKTEREGGRPGPRPRPHASRRSTDGGAWTELAFFLSDSELGDWDRLRDLLSHKLGTRDPQAVLEWLVELGLEKVDPVRQQARLEARRKARTLRRDHRTAESPTSSAENVPALETPRTDAERTAPITQRLTDVREAERHRRQRIPAPVRRRVWIRSEGRCQFVSPKTGLKCGSTAFLDVDHKIPLGEGGTDDESNLTLACSLHRRRPFWKPEDQPLYAAMLAVRAPPAAR